MTETGATDYNTSIHSVFGNVTTDSTAGVDTKTVADKTIVTTAGAKNEADFVNDKTSTPPTGIMLDVLPYVLMIGLAGGAVAITNFQKTRSF